MKLAGREEAQHRWGMEEGNPQGFFLSKYNSSRLFPFGEQCLLEENPLGESSSGINLFGNFLSLKSLQIMSLRPISCTWGGLRYWFHIFMVFLILWLWCMDATRMMSFWIVSWYRLFLVMVIFYLFIQLARCCAPWTFDGVIRSGYAERPFCNLFELTVTSLKI